MPEEKKRELFKVPKELEGKIEHSKPHIQAFDYHGDAVQLDKCTNERLLRIAADPSCAVLSVKSEKASQATKNTEQKSSDKK